MVINNTYLFPFFLLRGLCPASPAMTQMHDDMNITNIIIVISFLHIKLL